MMRHVELRLGLVAFFAALMAAASAEAFTRRIYDFSNPTGLGGGWSQLEPSTPGYPVQYTPYVFGRREGQPVRGPNPVPGEFFGSTDVDDMYDRIGVIQNYYLSRFGRDGANGSGGTTFPGEPDPIDQTTIHVHVSSGNFIAFTRYYPNDTAIQFGGGHTYYDLIGHEFAHLVTLFAHIEGYGVDDARQRTVAWSAENTNDAGAINEALSDFFGQAFEKYAAGTTDWTLAYDGAPVLCLSDPASIVDFATLTTFPDRNLSPNRFEGGFDKGGIHHNSTILSHGLFLATEGGSFNGFNVSGIGLEKMEQIAYRYQTEYYRSGGSYDGTFENDAYPGILQAATELYGPEEVWEVTKALRAVELNVPRSFIGDFDQNSLIDGNDVLTWQRGVGSEYSAALIDLWRTHFGESTTNQTAVPEPSALALLLAATLTICCCRARVVSHRS